MKSIYYTILLLVVGLSFPQTSTGQSTEEKLIGTWTLNYDATILKMESNMKAHFDTIPQLQRTQIEAVYKDRKVTFKSDGNYEQVLTDGRKTIGTWTLSNDKNIIEITDLKKKVYPQRIKKLNATTLVIALEGVVAAQALLSELHFTKSKN